MRMAPRRARWRFWLFVIGLVMLLWGIWGLYRGFPDFNAERVEPAQIELPPPDASAAP
jgi:hypothetical protein